MKCLCKIVTTIIYEVCLRKVVTTIIYLEHGGSTTYAWPPSLFPTILFPWFPVVEHQVKIFTQLPRLQDPRNKYSTLNLYVTEPRPGTPKWPRSHVYEYVTRGQNDFLFIIFRTDRLSTHQPFLGPLKNRFLTILKISRWSSWDKWKVHPPKFCWTGVHQVETITLENMYKNPIINGTRVNCVSCHDNVR